MVNTAPARNLLAANIPTGIPNAVSSTDVREVFDETLDLIDRIATVNVLEFGAKLDGVTDDTTAWNAALATGKVIIFPEGVSRVTNRLTMPSAAQGEGCTILGAGRLNSVFLISFSTFNMSAAGVVQYNSIYQAVRNVAFRFEQPPTTLRSAVKQYPPAIDFNGYSRCEVTGVLVEGGWVGFRMVGNCGGAIIDDVHMGVLSVGMRIDGALDSVRINRYHFWPFGLVVAAGLYEIYSDGVPHAMEIGRCDDLNMSSILTFRGGIIFDDYGSGSAFGVASNITLDSDYGRIEFNAGEMTLSSVYGSSSSGNDFAIRQTGGELRISGLALESGELSNPVVRISGAGTVFTATDIMMTLIGPNTIGFTVETNAVMMLSNGFFRAGTNQTRSVPLINVQNGRATLTALRCSDKGTGSGTFINVAADDFHVIANNAAPGWTYAFPATRPIGIYAPNI